MIKVCNAIMGSGKSSAAITYMNEHKDEKFIFVTPFLDEAKRIRDGCPDLNFIEPSRRMPKCNFSKVSHTEWLIDHGRNITTTHSAFKMYTKDMLTRIQDQGYTLIMDENVDVLDKFEANKTDLQIVLEQGFVKEVDGEFSITDREYNGKSLMDGLIGIAKSRNLVRVKDDKDEFFYWVIPVDLLTAFKDVFILTYMFECQSIYYYLQMHRLSYEYIGVALDENGVYSFVDGEGMVPEYVRSLKDKIHILDNERMNRIGKDKHDLSQSWFTRKPECVEQLKNNIYNCFRNIWKVPPAERMWSTFKSAFSKMKGKGYTKGFVVINSRATNNYRNKTCLVYAANIFMNVNEKLFYHRFGIEADEDMFALSTMIQWIWRSAIRDGKDINIYIPSKRMRTLFINWINSVSKGGDTG